MGWNLYEIIFIFSVCYVYIQHRKYAQVEKELEQWLDWGATNNATSHELWPFYDMMPVRRQFRIIQ